MNRKNLLVPLAVACGIVLLWWTLRPAGVRVEVAGVERRRLDVTVEEQGKTRARDRYTVAAPITGRLLRTAADEGMHVERGEILATMAPPPEDPRTEATIRAELTAADAHMREAEATLDEARTADEQARREAARRRDLFAQGAISTERHEQYERSAKAARARLETARAGLRAARADVDRARSRLLGAPADDEGAGDTIISVRAPADGTVFRVHEESERVVLAGTPLFELGVDRGLELVIDLLTEDAVQVEAGDPIRITGWGGDAALEGRVRYVEPQAFTEVSALGVEEQRVNVIGDLIDPPSSLGAGYRIEAAIVTWSGEGVLTVPTSAIFRGAKGWRAFVVEGGRARLREIEIGRRGKEHVQLSDGLEEGEQVIVFPSDLVEDGARVAVIESSS